MASVCDTSLGSTGQAVHIPLIFWILGVQDLVEQSLRGAEWEGG